MSEPLVRLLRMYPHGLPGDLWAAGSLPVTFMTQVLIVLLIIKEHDINSEGWRIIQDVFFVRRLLPGVADIQAYCCVYS